MVYMNPKMGGGWKDVSIGADRLGGLAFVAKAAETWSALAEGGRVGSHRSVLLNGLGTEGLLDDGPPAGAGAATGLGWLDDGAGLGWLDDGAGLGWLAVTGLGWLATGTGLG